MVTEVWRTREDFSASTECTWMGGKKPNSQSVRRKLGPQSFSQRSRWSDKTGQQKMYTCQPYWSDQPHRWNNPRKVFQCLEQGQCQRVFDALVPFKTHLVRRLEGPQLCYLALERGLCSWHNSEVRIRVQYILTCWRIPIIAGGGIPFVWKVWRRMPTVPHPRLCYDPEWGQYKVCLPRKPALRVFEMPNSVLVFES